MQRNKKQRKILTLVIFATLAFIWGHSMMGPEKSSEESGFFLGVLTPFLEIFVGKGNVTEFLVRKLAHFSEFGLLGVELHLFFGLFGDGDGSLAGSGNWLCRPWHGYLLAVAHALFAALTDETVQIFSSRGSQVQDVWLDVAGGATGALCLWALCRLVVRVRTRRSAEK